MKQENDMFLKQQAAIKEDRWKQSEEKSNAILKQLNEIIELERSAEREEAELRRKRYEVMD